MAAGNERSDASREIVVTRVFDAPPEVVFDAWTDRNAIATWWGPNGFTTTTYDMDVRPGGVWRFMMHGPDGTDYPNRIAYHEVEKPRRLAYTHGGDEGVNFEVVVTFEAEGEKTRITMRSLFATAEERDKVVTDFGAIEGANQTLNRLAEHLAKK